MIRSGSEGADTQTLDGTKKSTREGGSARSGLRTHRKVEGHFVEIQVTESEDQNQDQNAPGKIRKKAEECSRKFQKIFPGDRPLVQEDIVLQA